MTSPSETFGLLKKWQEESVLIEFLRPESDLGSGALDSFVYVRVKDIFPSDLIAILTNLGSNTAIALHFSPDSFDCKTQLDGTFGTSLLRTFDSTLEAKLCDGTRVLFIKRKPPN